MSAIAAILNREGSAEARSIRAMLAAAPHRGSDIEVLSQGRCVLGICRHKEWPESAIATEGGIAVAFTGTIDNCDSLVNELEGRGLPSIQPTPAGVLLAGFRVYGEKLPNMLRGAFAAVLTDGSRLWAFRDHVGFKPLFFREDARGCYLATEAKQIVAGAGIPREPDHDVLKRIFYKEYDDNTPSALKGVRRLPKATLLVAGDDGIVLRRYWQPERLLESAGLSEEDIRDRFGEVMTQAVARILTGHDVLSLSGGIDSPAIAAFAAPEYLKLTGRPLPVLSFVFPHLPSVDERPYIEMIVSALGLELHTYEISANPLDRLRQWADVLDGPVPHIWISDSEEYYRVAKALGFRTILTGEAAEFLVEMRPFILQHLIARGRWKAAAEQIRVMRSARRSWKSIGGQVASTFLPGFVEAAYTRVRRPYRSPRIPDWLDPRVVNEVKARHIVPVRHRWKDHQLHRFTGPGLSIEVEADEICQVLCGVRTRMPWADVDLWEFFLSLPAEVKYPYPQRKALVRRLLRGKVPEPVLDRQDKTFSDDSVKERFRYEMIRYWLLEKPYRLEGVDYKRLTERIEQRRFDTVDILWSVDLAKIHAFLDLWQE